MSVRLRLLVGAFLVLATAGAVASDNLGPVAARSTPPAGHHGTPQATPVAVQGEVIREPHHSGVIVPEAIAPAFVAAFIGGGAEGYWTPQATEVARLESALGPYLRQAALARSPDLWQRLPEYTRQYVGLLDDRRQRILVNAFRDDLGTDWRTTPVAVLDGGDCYFQVTYDVASGAFSDLTVNGEA